MIKEYIIKNQTAFPDLNITIDKVIVKDDMMVRFCTYKGTNKGPFWDLPATGKKLKLHGVTIFRFINGKEVEIWDFHNTLDIMEQINFMFSPPSLQNQKKKNNNQR